MRKRRQKVTHTQGVVARVEWEVVGDHGYTGIFGEGSDHAIIRMSEASNIVEASTGLTPSMAIKFLVDGKKSVNLFAMPRSFSSTGSWDFFSEPISNRVDTFTAEEKPIEQQTLQKKMVESSTTPFKMALGKVARTQNDGENVHRKLVSMPYEIEYRGVTHFSHDKELDEAGNQVMFYDQLKRLEEGSTLYEVWGLTAPHVLGGEWVHMANINLETPLYTSNFGDTRLFFQHTRHGSDRRFWPKEWRDLQEDAFFERAVFNGDQIPDTWPTDPQEAETLYNS